MIIVISTTAVTFIVSMLLLLLFLLLSPLRLSSGKPGIPKFVTQLIIFLLQAHPLTTVFFFSKMHANLYWFDNLTMS